MSFVVVEFVDEEAVEVAHKSWITKKENNMFCYWPRTGASTKVKREELPDTKKWSSYEIRIFSAAETYSKAVERAKRAEVTSNVETYFESPQSRPIKKPARFDSSEDEEADDGNDNSLGICHTPTVALLPQPPRLNKVNVQFDASSRESSPLPPKTRDFIVQNVTESTPEVPQKSKRKHLLNKSRSSVEVNDQASSSGSANSGPRKLVAVSEAETSDIAFRTTVLAQLTQLTPVLTRLDTLEKTQLLILKLLESSAKGSGGVDVEDVLPAPVRSTEDLNDLCTKLADPAFKTKLTLLLSSFGGHSLGDTVRRIFKKLGTNSVWSSYSLKGKKGKLAFADLPICPVIIRACLKNYTEAKISAVEDEISEALKHAPKRKGGLKYKEPEPKRHECLLRESSDYIDKPQRHASPRRQTDSVGQISITD